MKIKQLIIPLISILFLFSSCEPFETDICQITVNENEHCTFTLPESSVPRFSFAKIQIKPEAGYYLSDIVYLYDSLNYFKSTDEEDTYYFLAEKEELTVSIKLKEKTKYQIKTEIKKGTITPSKTDTYEGDTVSFTVAPDEFYYIDPSLIKVINGYVNTSYEFEERDSLEILQSQTNTNEFSFIMPDNRVTIYVPLKYGFTSIKSQKDIYEKDEKIIFDIENHTPDAKFDVYYVNNYKLSKTRDYGEKILSDVKLSDTLEIPEDTFEWGTEFCIIVYPHSYDYKYPEIISPSFTINRTPGVF